MTVATPMHDPFAEDGSVAAGRAASYGRRPIKYRLNVIGPTVVDVVTCSGGWLFDRVMAGWEVNVLVAELDRARPLEILGARTFDLESALPSMRKAPRPQALAVSTSVFDDDERVRLEVFAALRHGSVEVTFWGPGSPRRIDRTVSAVQHHLTRAAKAFKGHALAAAAVEQRSVGPTESFFGGGTSFRSWPH